jgi:hypothetical protein
MPLVDFRLEVAFAVHIVALFAIVVLLLDKTGDRVHIFFSIRLNRGLCVSKL